MGSGRAKNAVEYLDAILEKGRATSGAIAPLKIAFTKVMETVDGENWKETEVRDIDIDDYMNRFANLTLGKYSPESLIVYKSRVNKVVKWYIQFLDKPGWMPDVPRRTRKHKENQGTADDIPASTQHNKPSPYPDENQGAQRHVLTPSSNRILYPFPLLDGQLIHVSLPIKLSKEDARRIGAFIESIAMVTETERGKV